MAFSASLHSLLPTMADVHSVGIARGKPLSSSVGAVVGLGMLALGDIPAKQRVQAAGSTQHGPWAK